MKKIKILQVNKLYKPWIGGIEQVVQDISEGLKEKIDTTVLVCQPKGKKSTDIINGINVVRTGSIGIYFSMPVSFSYIFALKKYSKESDIIHIHEPFPLGDLAILMSNYKGKVAVWWHGDIVKQKKLVNIFKPIIKKLLKRADIIFVSSFQIAISSSYISAFKDKCIEIPLGIKFHLYEDAIKAPVLKNVLNNPKNKKVLFVGRLVRFKGVEVLIHAFKNVTGAELFIVGSGILENDLKQLVNKYQIQHKVHFLGAIYGNELKTIFSDCDMLVFPSINTSESFGIVQIEAMVYGKPVINTNLPTGVPFVSIDKETGLTISVGDVEELSTAIQLLIDNDELRELYGRNAKIRTYEKFDINIMLNNIYNQYLKLLDLPVE